MDSTVLVATWSDGLFAITGDARTQEIVGQSVQGLTADGRGGALAIVDGHAVCRRAAGGPWVTVATSEFGLSCCLAVHDTIYAGTDDARLLRLSPDGDRFEPMEGFDTVAGRDCWFAGSAIVDGQRVGPPLGIRSVAANASGSVLYANVHVGGIPRSMDSGRTWQPTIDIQSDVHEVCAHPTDPDVVAAASAIGLCISRDAGVTWTVEKEGLHASHCSAVVFWEDEVLFSGATDPFAAHGRLYRWSLDGESMKAEGKIAAVENGLPAWTNGIVDTGCIASSGSMIAMVDRGGTLYWTTALRRAWSKGRGTLPIPSSILIC